jgi:hypothetical protein
LVVDAQEASVTFQNRALLLTDGIVNLALGAALLLLPTGLLDILGLPTADTFFYSSVLGAVLFGIGIALLLELKGGSGPVRGLGLGGAIAINLCGGGAVLVWLLVVPSGLPLRGRVVLGIVGAAVLVIAVVELVARSWRRD